MDIGGIEIIETGSRLLMAEDVAELTEYIEQLESENAKLRSMRDTWQENDAKLRELAKEAVAMAREFYNLGGTYNDLDELLCEASELGIEVD